uniref:C2H2-type domain-containing protein n=1 Tax=Wuchereria bancrofti TaxID=6293 RepID=A0AAF5Q5P2_WUCBA
MFFTASITPIIWFNLLLCIASDKNETFHLPNFDPYSGISDSFDILDYNNFEPLSSSEFPSDPSQFIDFTQLSEIEDIGNEESKSETGLVTNAPHLGFSNSYDLFGHTNLELSLGSDMDSYWNAWRDADGESRTNDDSVRYPSIRDVQGETSSLLNLDTNGIYFYQLTLPSDDTSGQHGNAEQSDIDNKHFSNSLNIFDYRGNTDGESKTDKRNYACHYPGCAVITKNYGEYITHRKTHGQPFIYECKVPDCGRTFDHKSAFHKHKQTHESHPQCEDCGKFFVSRDGLQKHKKHCQTKSRERSYECLYRGCTMIAKSYNEYVTHRKTHGQPFTYECRMPGCGQTFHHESSLRSHKQTHESNPQCKGCGKLFASRNTLQNHKKRCSTEFR